MLYKFINKPDSQEKHSKLILIFAGWSTTPEFYSDIIIAGWDTMVIYDYNDADFDVSILSGYETIYLYAWSLGVYMASVVLHNSYITAAYAINGTLNPVNDLYGIPDSIFIGTMGNLSKRNLVKFRRRMAGSKDIFEKLITEQDPPIEYLANQLKYIYNLYQDLEYKENTDAIRWRMAYISAEDAIFPYNNQLNSWNNHKVRTFILEGSHVPDFKRIIRETIISPHKVGKAFDKASTTYDIAASAQGHIAAELAQKFNDLNINNCESIIEIGPGTGILTDKYAEFLKPDEVIFIDVATMPEYNRFPTERYIQGDAEEILNDSYASDCIDIIVSSSVMQWFINPKRFIANASKILKRGGYLILSTFGEENLKELNDIRTGLHYSSISDLQGWLSEYFTEINISEDKMTLTFNDSRHLLMHLRNTGVSGSLSTANISPFRLSHLRHLTYHPIYIIARK